MKITVFTPTYNRGYIIENLFKSLQRQTFRDFELIFVDNGSPDNCYAICDEYAAQDSRIHVIHQKNGGMSPYDALLLDGAGSEKAYEGAGTFRNCKSCCSSS